MVHKSVFLFSIVSTVLLYVISASGQSQQSPKVQALTKKFENVPQREVKKSVGTKANAVKQQPLNVILNLGIVLDTTDSIRQNLEDNLKTQFPDFLNDLLKIFPFLRVGLISFRDKPILPFGASSDFCAKKISPLTKKFQDVIKEFLLVKAGGGGDLPENPLEAMLYAMTDEADMGWITKPTKDGIPVANFIYVITDADYKEAPFWTTAYVKSGGKSPSIKPKEPSLGLKEHCKVKEYPDTSYVAKRLEELNIIPVFAVPTSLSNKYNTLTSKLKRGMVGFADVRTPEFFEDVKQVLVEAVKKAEKLKFILKMKTYTGKIPFVEAPIEYKEYIAKKKEEKEEERGSAKASGQQKGETKKKLGPNIEKPVSPVMPRETEPERERETVPETKRETEPETERKTVLPFVPPAAGEAAQKTKQEDTGVAFPEPKESNLGPTVTKAEEVPKEEEGPKSGISLPAETSETAIEEKNREEEEKQKGITLLPAELPEKAVEKKAKEEAEKQKGIISFPAEERKEEEERRKGAIPSPVETFQKTEEKAVSEEDEKKKAILRMSGNTLKRAAKIGASVAAGGLGIWALHELFKKREPNVRPIPPPGPVPPFPEPEPEPVPPIPEPTPEPVPPFPGPEPQPVPPIPGPVPGPIPTPDDGRQPVPPAPSPKGGGVSTPLIVAGATAAVGVVALGAYTVYRVQFADATSLIEGRFEDEEVEELLADEEPRETVATTDMSAFA